MQVVLNGEPYRIEEETISLLDLCESLSLSVKDVVIEVDKSIYHSKDFHTVQLHSGQSIEILHFIGGGSARPNIK